MEAKEKLAVGGGLVNKLATVLEVLAVAGLDAIAAIWVLAKEDKVEQGILTPGNVLQWTNLNMHLLADQTWVNHR